MREVRARHGLHKSIWPDRWAGGDYRAAFRFLTECCYTWNEANGLIERIPAHEYIEYVAYQWVLSRDNGEDLIIEKSRRLAMSWVVSGLELWSMGHRLETRVLCGLDYRASGKHVWRLHHLHKQLAKRRPMFPAHFELPMAIGREGNEQAREFRMVMLPNGSTIEALNQDGGEFQGDGYTGVRMEEFSQYDHPGYMWAQAHYVTMGIPGKTGGNVVAVCNAWPNEEWQEIKAEPTKSLAAQEKRKVVEHGALELAILRAAESEDQDSRSAARRLLDAGKW